MVDFARYSPKGTGYELSSKGDRRFSALNARLRDGRTIEEAYQLDVKGYRTVSNDWRTGKGKPPMTSHEKNDLWQQYLALWQQWARENPHLIEDLRVQSQGKTLTDMFASTGISQARALAEILNQTSAMTQQPITEKSPPVVAPVQAAFEWPRRGA